MRRYALRDDQFARIEGLLLVVPAAGFPSIGRINLIGVLR